MIEKLKQITSMCLIKIVINCLNNNIQKIYTVEIIINIKLKIKEIIFTKSIMQIKTKITKQTPIQISLHQDTIIKVTFLMDTCTK